jgi:hypothetical protein
VNDYKAHKSLLNTIGSTLDHLIREKAKRARQQEMERRNMELYQQSQVDAEAVEIEPEVPLLGKRATPGA